MFPSIRQSYKPHVQPRVEPNLHNTLPRVKRSGSEIPGQAYDYRTSWEGAVPRQELDRWREGTLDGGLREVPPESSTIGEVRKPRIPLDTLVPQIDATGRLGGLDNFVESRRQNFREVRLVLAKHN